MSCISGLMAARDPRATNELQVMALFCLGYSLLIRSLPHALEIVGSRCARCRSICPTLSPSSNASGTLGRIGVIAIGFRFCLLVVVPRAFSRIFTPNYGQSKVC